MSKKCPAFTKKQLNTMFKAIKESNKTGKEIGFTLKTKNRKVDLGSECIGDECSIWLGERKYGGGGFFHTHPVEKRWKGPTYLIASLQDLKSGAALNERYMCVGGDQSYEVPRVGYKRKRIIKCNVKNLGAKVREKKGYGLMKAVPTEKEALDFYDLKNPCEWEKK